MKHWTLDDIPWDKFDPSRVDPDILCVIKAAGMVEYNGRDYATYLRNVFHDDARFQAVALEWAEEEVQHGLALGRWAEMADPDFNFEASFKAFTDGYRIPIEVESSVRGSRTGELVARCIVETGTSSFYSALHDATDEPVLREICRRIAADEFRHYKLFYDYMKRYRDVESVGLWSRLSVALGRLKESDDDELAFAYHCGNTPGQVYDRKRSNEAYAARAYGCYRPAHVQRAVGMVFKAVGLKPQGWLGRAATRLACRFMQKRSAIPA